MVDFYGYKKCSTCRKAEKDLQAKGVDYNFIDIIKTPPSKSLLNKILGEKRGELRPLFNTSGVMYRELQLKNKLKSMGKEEALNLLSKYGKLTKRPLVDGGDQVAIGYDPIEFSQKWG